MKKMKNWICMITGLMLLSLLICMPTTAWAEEIESSGTYGDSITWTLYEDDVLYLEGTGELTYENREDLPWYNRWITDVYISAGITSFEAGAFGTDTPRLWVAEGNPNYSSDEFGVLFNQDKSTLIAAPQSLEGYYEIPQTVTNIETMAFSACTDLCGVQIPDGVTEIGYGVFLGCSSLHMVKLPDTLTKIGDSAFSYCGITSISLPESLQIIGGNAFANAKLRCVTIPANVHTIEYNAFRRCYDLVCVIWQTKSATIGQNAFEDTMISHAMFAGTESQWSNLQFERNADVFRYDYVTMHYSCNKADSFAVSQYGDIHCTICDGVCDHAGYQENVYNVANASCSREGMGYYWCYDCDMREYFVIEKNDSHNPGPDATETEPQICLDCGKVLQLAWGDQETGDDPGQEPENPGQEPEEPNEPSAPVESEPTFPSVDDDDGEDNETSEKPNGILKPNGSSNKDHKDDDLDEDSGKEGVVVIVIAAVAILAGVVAFVLLRKKK